MTVGALSRPGVAGTRITRFRPESCSSSNPCRSAHSRTCSIAGSSCREGRAIFVSASKWDQNGRGSSPVKTDVSVAISLASLMALADGGTLSGGVTPDHRPDGVNFRARMDNAAGLPTSYAAGSFGEVTTQRLSLVAGGAVLAVLVGVFSTWASYGPVSLNGTQGPNNGWLVVIF